MPEKVEESVVASVHEEANTVEQAPSEETNKVPEEEKAVKAEGTAETKVNEENGNTENGKDAKPKTEDVKDSDVKEEKKSNSSWAKSTAIHATLTWRQTTNRSAMKNGRRNLRTTART